MLIVPAVSTIISTVVFFTTWEIGLPRMEVRSVAAWLLDYCTSTDTRTRAIVSSGCYLADLFQPYHL
jgi:hypothetical protein